MLTVKKGVVYTVAGTMGLGVSSLACAQDRAGALEEVVVTATKREASIQDIAVSITAIDGESLARYNQDTIESITAQTPSMAYSEAAGEAQIYLRGVGTNIFGIAADPSVGVHMDGVYQGRNQLALNQFLDIQRVEVLRGPQGTLYGRNTTAGAINILSRRPGDSWEGYVRGGIGSWDRRELSAAIGGPVSEQVSVRVAARHMQDDGYTENINPSGGVDVDDNDIQQVRGSVRFTPNDRFRLTLIADGTQSEDGNTSVRPRDNLGAAEVLGAAPPPSFGKIRNDLQSFNEWDTSGFTAELEWALNDAWTVSGVSGYRDFNGEFLFNTDGTEIDITRTQYAYDTDQLSHELRLGFDDGGRLRALVGVFYLKEDKDQALGLVRAGGRPLFASSPGSRGSFVIPSTNETEASAIFSEVTYGITERLDLSLGLRYSKETKEDTSSVGAVFDLEGLNSPSDPLVFSNRDDKESWSDTTPKVGLEYRATDDVLLYLSWSEGFKSGGFNSLDANPSYDPEELSAWEAGIKSDWFDNTLRVNASAFYYDYQDLQVSTFINNLTLTTNAAEATIYGMEGEVVARPLPALEVGLAFSLLDAEYDEFSDRLGNNPDGTPRVLDLSGNRMPNAPEMKSTLHASYMHSFGDGSSLILSGRYMYQSRVYFSQFNENDVAQASIGLFDASLSWASADGLWEVTLAGRNLTDEDYFHTGVRFTSTSDADRDPLGIGSALGYPAAGRSWGLNIQRSF
ncbi:MAG TPA: hypothetical protein DD491_14390 [Halieaceae bacterium]|nr:hypothetical protein [Halieaceae bacterium]